MHITESRVRLTDRMEGAERLKQYVIWFDWDEGNLILVKAPSQPDGSTDEQKESIRKRGRILATGLTPEEYVDIEIHVKVRE